MKALPFLRRALVLSARAALVLVLFVLLVVAVALAGLNLPVARKMVATQVTALIASELKGTITIERIGHIDPFGVAGVRVRVRDPEGRLVLFADGVSARVDTVRLVGSILRGGTPEIELTVATVEHIDLSLDADATGELTLVRAVTPREPTPPARPPPASSSSGGVRLNIARGLLRHAWVHGRPPGGPPLDAELRDADATVSIAPDRIDIALRRAAIEGRGMPEGADPRGDVGGHITLPRDKSLVLDGKFYGDVGGLTASAVARLEGQRLTATLVARTVENVDRRLASEVPLTGPLVLRASASGPLSKLDVQVRARLGSGTVDVDGEVSLDPVIRVLATVRAAHIDLRNIVRDAPRSDMGAIADASVVFSDGEPHGDFRVLTSPGRIGQEAIPVMTASAKLTGTRLDATLFLERRGARALVALCLRKAGAQTLLDVDATATIPDLRSIPGVPATARGRGHLFARGTVTLESKTLSGHVVADVTDAAEGEVGIARAFLDARADGPLAAPRIDAALYAEHLSVGNAKFRSGTGHVRGTPARALVAVSLEGDEFNPSLAATAHVEVGTAITLRDVSAASTRDGTTAMAGSRLVRIAGSQLSIEHAVVLGLGEPLRLNAHLARDEIRLELDSRGVDFRRVAAVAGLSTGRFRGRVAADVNLLARRSGATGRAQVDLTDATFGDGSSGQGHVDVRVDADRIEGTLQGTWSGSRIDLRTEDLRLGGPPTELSSWGRAFGKMNLDVDADLGRVRKILPESILPFEEMGGRLRVSLGLSRKVAGATPEATLAVRTTAFRLSRKGRSLEPSDGTAVRGPAVWHVSGIDLDLDAVANENGDEASFHGRLHDEHGVLLDLALRLPFPPAAALTEPTRLRTFLEASTMQVHASVPRRNIANFPDSLGRTTMDGSVELTVDGHGRLGDPNVAFVFDLRDFRAQHHAPTPPIGAHVVGGYDGREAKIDALVTGSGKPALSLTALGHVKVGDLLAKRGDMPWDASAQAKLERLPLESVPQLADQRVRGQVSGDAELTLGVGTPSRFHAKLDVGPLSVGRLRDNRASVQVDADERSLNLATRIDHPDGFLAAKAMVGVTWPTWGRPPPGVPTRLAEPAHLDLEARNFRLATLRPFVRDFVNRLDGRLDAAVHVDVANDGKNTTARGHAQVRDGAFELPTMGDEFQSVRAKARFDPNGVIVVDDLHARGTTGSVSGNAVLRMEGLGFASARGDFRIPKNEPLPISVEGQLLGESWGRFHVEATRSPGSGETDIKVDIPVAGVILPDKSTHSLQPLEPAERVRIGVYRAPRQFEVLPGGPTASTDGEDTAAPVRIAVHVKDLEVRRGTNLRVRLAGNPLVRLGPDAGVTGAIVLHEGFLDVQGKRFEIERGTITFIGEADNPEVVVTAGWTAPEGTRVLADFVGPLKTGKVTLRSEPAHTNSEILSLILFGTTTGSSSPMAPGTSSADANAQAAAGVGGGFATQGLNRALDDLTGLDVTARVDTSDSANPRPELEVRIARDVSVALAHVLGLPPPGANPDRNLATVDWRFKRNWSVQTTFGDAGSSMLDFVWQYRY